MYDNKHSGFRLENSKLKKKHLKRQVYFSKKLPPLLHFFHLMQHRFTVDFLFPM